MTSQADRDKSRALRIAAELAGEMKFESFAPCSNGHFVRYVSSGDCVECTIARVEQNKKKNLERTRSDVWHRAEQKLQSGRIVLLDGLPVKRCPVCTMVKEITMFYPNPSRPYGCSSRCMACDKVLSHKRYHSQKVDESLVHAKTEVTYG